MGYQQKFSPKWDFENRLKAYWQIYWAFLQSLRPPLDEMKLEGSKSFNIAKRQIPLQTEWRSQNTGHIALPCFVKWTPSHGTPPPATIQIENAHRTWGGPPKKKHFVRSNPKFFSSCCLFPHKSIPDLKIVCLFKTLLFCGESFAQFLFSSFLTLNFFQNHWKLLKTIETYWKSLKVIENHSKLLEIIESYWKLLKVIANQLSPWKLCRSCALGDGKPGRVLNCFIFVSIDFARTKTNTDEQNPTSNIDQTLFQNILKGQIKTPVNEEKSL